MTCRIAAFDGGTYYHIKALNEPAWADLIDERLYLPDLGAADLAAFDVLIATCRSNYELIQPHRDRIARFLDGGGTVVAFAGTAPERWLPGVAARPVPTNYWWWLDRDADSGLRLVAPEHSLFTAVTLADCTWHHHCRFLPPEGAVSLIDHSDGGSVFYEDRSVAMVACWSRASIHFFIMAAISCPPLRASSRGFYPGCTRRRITGARRTSHDNTNRYGTRQTPGIFL